jgi:epoxyqueuosine reductase
MKSFEHLQKLASKHGFDDIRVTSSQEHGEAKRIFANWLKQSHHADMDWLARDPERRTDPVRLMPQAESILTLAVNYWREPGSLEDGQGRVALYAAGQDYHRVLERGMKALIRDLDESNGAHYRYYVDYGPVLERAFAERSGLGFIGRSANLIHPRFGTYVFIATIITDAVFPVTEPRAGTCGRCTRCLDICPTGALKSPYELDANLCISYLTIENRGPIPRHLRPLIGTWLFGCDLCQEVCPYNDKAERGVNVAIAGESIAGTRMDVAEILAIRSAEDFSKRFSRSAVKRAKREGLVRNAAVVAGNLRQPSLVPALKESCGDASPLVRGHAVWALGEYGETHFVAELRDQENDAFVLSEMDEVMGQK